MLKKLLKYDFKAVIKLWLIGVSAILLLSVVGGFCFRLDEIERELPYVVYVVSGFVRVFVIMGYMAILVLTPVLIFVRFYKNFFTDEGYLTFTLPVSRAQLLNSKIIMCTVINWLTGFAVVSSIIIMILIGLKQNIFSPEFWKDFLDLLKDIFKGYGAIYVILSLTLSLVYSLLSVLFLSSCITLASTIVKKAKVITAIGIYYGVNSTVGFVVQLLMIFGITEIGEWISVLPDSLTDPVVILVMLGIILLMVSVCSVLYNFQLWMLEKKLNLS